MEEKNTVEAVSADDPEFLNATDCSPGRPCWFVDVDGQIAERNLLRACPKYVFTRAAISSGLVVRKDLRVSSRGRYFISRVEARRFAAEQLIERINSLEAEADVLRERVRGMKLEPEVNDQPA